MPKRQDFNLMIQDVKVIQLESLKIQLKKIIETPLLNSLDNNFNLIKKQTDKNVL